MNRVGEESPIRKPLNTQLYYEAIQVSNMIEPESPLKSMQFQPIKKLTKEELRAEVQMWRKAL